MPTSAVLSRHEPAPPEVEQDPQSEGDPAPASESGGGPPAEPAPETAAEPAPPVPWRAADILLVLAAVMLFGMVLDQLLRSWLPPAVATGWFLPVSMVVLGGSTVALVQVRYQAGRRLFGDGPHRLRDMGIGLGAGIAAFIVVNIGLGLLLAGREPPEVQRELTEAALDPQAAVLVVLGGVLLGPLAEEVFFRGFLFRMMRRRLSLWPAVGLSSVIFALAHFQDTIEGTLLLFVAFFPLGMFLAWIFERRGSLLAPVACHAGFNLVNFSYLYFAQELVT